MKAVFGLGALAVVLAVPVLASKQEGSPSPTSQIGVTPADRPNLQVFFLAQLANVAKSEFVREKLRQAATPIELLNIIEAADPAVTG